MRPARRRRASAAVVAGIALAAIAACSSRELEGSAGDRCARCHGNPPPAPHVARPECWGCHPDTAATAGALVPDGLHLSGAVEVRYVCDACHGNPPPPPHPGLAECHRCHPGTATADGGIVAGGLHLNGVVDVDMGASCDACHGAPPAGGAHLRHASVPEGAQAAYGSTAVLEDLAAPGSDPDAYGFGCGHCHPLDPARHMDGALQVDLSPAGAPAGSLRARNLPAAAFDLATGTCAGAACHSSGEPSPPAERFAATPPRTSAASLACDGCHANPPRHPSGGPGADDANSHLQLQADGWEWGHFGGLPGPWHGGPKHGVEPGVTDGAPITCQACHAATVDPAATLPGGFFWIDTTGDYDLGGPLGYACADCHGAGAGAPAAGAGRVRPLAHVNGRRDVVFDSRTALPALPWLPAPPDRPTRPYWVRPGAITLPDPFDGGVEGTTLSLHLAGASYDPATKTCANVACHLFETEVRWGAPHDGWDACSRCHPF